MARIRLLTVIFVVALVGVACGSDTAAVVAGPSLQPSAEAEAGEGIGTGLTEDDEGGASTDADGTSGDASGALAEDFKLDISGLGEGGAAEETAAESPPSDGEAGELAGATFLRSVASETSSVDSYRFEVRFEMFVADRGTVLDIAPDEPLSVGAVSGSRTRIASDIGPVFDAIFAAAGNGSVRDFLGDDLSMEAITDGTSLYLRAPLFASLAQLGALPGAEDLVALGDGWGYVDLGATGLTAEELAGLTGAQTGASAEDLLAMLGAVGGQVVELGAGEVRGVATTRYRAEMSLGAVLEAQNMSADEIGALSAAGIGEVTIPFDIDVDADGRVRRMEVVIDTSFIAEVAGESVPAGTEARISTVVELFDFGADIDIVDPTTLDATDVTASFLALANA